ncbi:MAG: class I adenylate-forming enzyme family protein [Cellvibrionales bacterium]
MRTSPSTTIEHYQRLGWWGKATLRSLFDKALRDFADREALLDPPNRQALVGGEPNRLSYAQIDALTDKLGCLMYASGLRQGDKVLLQMPNVVEIVLVYLAASRLGLIVSPVAMQYGQFELKTIDKLIRPRAYIGFQRFKGERFAGPQSDCLDEGCQTLIIDGRDFCQSVTIDASALSALGDIGAKSIDAKGVESNRLDAETFDTEALESAYQCYIEQLEIDANDIFTICWTSGTTGRSKGVPRSHNHWLASTLASQDAIKLRPGAVMLNPFPFINMAAIGGFLFYWLQIGAKLVLHHPFEANLLMSQLQNEAVQYTIFPPAVLSQLLGNKDIINQQFDLSSIEIVGSGSAPLSPGMITGFKSEFDIDVVNIFGSNEGMSLLSNPIDVPDPTDRAGFFPRFGRADLAWDNRIAARIETKLVDIVSGEEITERGRAGECLIKGPTVFDGYYDAPDDNASAFSDDGYFRSGDLFEIDGDHDQYYRFVGRCKSLILRGGVNISPEELDEILIGHPAIAEVAVAGYADQQMGERIAAFAVLHAGESLTLEQLTGYMRDLSVAAFKWPERLEILMTLPRNAMNKVMRNQLVSD